MFVLVGTTAAAIGASSALTQYYGVQLKADDDNAGDIFIGQDDTVTGDGTAATDGMRLAPGDPLFLPPTFATNLSQIYAIATQADQKLYILLPNRQS